MKRKITAVALLGAILVLMLTGCGGGTINRPTMKPGAAAFSVTGSCKAELQGTTLTVSGVSNIADGTLATISVYSPDGKQIEIATIAKSGDNLKHDFTVTSKWPDEVYGFLTFDNYQAGTQPQNIQDLYGSQLENLQGSNVVWDTHGAAAVFESDAVKIK
jgi:hypothetical protein